MSNWSPEATRRHFRLAITAGERAEFEARMAPLERRGGLFDAHAVLEGGGVLCLAFLGAARCCHDFGIRWHGLAGSSAGALLAALLATDLPNDYLEYELGRINFDQFLRPSLERSAFQADPVHALEQPIQLLVDLAMHGELGLCSTDALTDWLEEFFYRAGMPTFGMVGLAGKSEAERQLKVGVSDLTRGTMLLLPDDLDPPPAARPAASPALSPRQRDFKLSHAVQLSMSIPWIFQPGHLDLAAGRSIIQDGSLLSNFPLWLFDHDRFGQPSPWPTIGFRLVDRGFESTQPIASVPALFSIMLKTALVAGPCRHESPRHRGCVVEIDLTGLGVHPVSFHLNHEQKSALYVRGYECTKEFFLRVWNWRQHAAQRTAAAGLR